MTAVTKTAAAARPKLTIAGAKARPTIIPSAPQLFPLRQLVRAAENVRRIRSDEDVAGLAENIQAHGLLQSLIGYLDPRAGGDTVQIVGGGRRLQALDSLMMDGMLQGDWPVPVLIRDREQAVELSLAENLQQRTMSPVDEVFAFKALIDTGHHSAAEMAKRFGFSERVVKQRLRLADLAPEILDALAERAITLDAAMAYAGTQDRALQSEIFTAEGKRSWDQHSVRNIRLTIESRGIRTTHPLYRFVGAGIYEARGGGYEDDLFRGDPDGARVLTNPALLQSIAAELIEERFAGRLADLQADPKLSPTITGHITVPGLKLASWGAPGAVPAPPGCAIVTYHESGPMWRRIRDGGIAVRILAGIDDAGGLTVSPTTVAVDRAQRDVICPPVVTAASGYAQPTPEQRAEIETARGMVRWSRRLAVNALGGRPLFAGTPLEGRAIWPGSADGEPGRHDGAEGVFVPVLIFVSGAEIAVQRKAAGARYAQELAEREQARSAVEAVQAEKDRRIQELSDMEPPAIVVLDGAAWSREEDGTFASTTDDADPFSDWDQLLDVAASEGVEIGETFDTREAWKAAVAAADGAQL